MYIFTWRGGSYWICSVSANMCAFCCTLTTSQDVTLPSPIQMWAYEFFGTRGFYIEVRSIKTKQRLGALMDVVHAGWSIAIDQF